MEALWTRFHPLTKEVKQIAEEGTLGDPVVLHADLAGDFDIESEYDEDNTSNEAQIACRYSKNPSNSGPAARRRCTA